MTYAFEKRRYIMHATAVILLLQDSTQHARVRKRRQYNKIQPRPTSYVFFCTTAPSGPGPLHSRGLKITPNDASQSVGLLWTSDQPVSETST